MERACLLGRDGTYSDVLQVNDMIYNHSVVLTTSCSPNGQIMCYRKYLLYKNKLFIMLLLILVAVYQFRNADQMSFDTIRYFQNVNMEWSTTVQRFKNYQKHLINYKNSLQNVTRLRKDISHQVQCKEAPFLLILVHSKPNGLFSRQALRNSWASHSGPSSKIKRYVKSSHESCKSRCTLHSSVSSSDLRDKLIKNSNVT